MTRKHIKHKKYNLNKFIALVGVAVVQYVFSCKNQHHKLHQPFHKPHKRCDVIDRHANIVHTVCNIAHKGKHRSIIILLYHLEQYINGRLQNDTPSRVFSTCSLDVIDV